MGTEKSKPNELRVRVVTENTMMTTLPGKAVVTGASGFIGSHLVERLAELKYSVLALGHANSEARLGNLAHLSPAALEQVEFRLIDVLDQQDLKKAFQDAAVVFHLAAQISVPYSFRAPFLFVQTNSVGTLNVLQAALDTGVGRVVVVSSSEVYGGAAEKICESHQLCARSPYAASKIAAEKIAEAFWHTYGLGAVTVRPFNTFGPRQSLRAVIPWIIKQALETDEIVLGNLNSVRDLVYVADTVNGMIAAGTTANVEGSVFNLATGCGISVADIVLRVGKILGRSLKVRQAPELSRSATSEVWELIGNPSKAAERLGWQSQIPLNEGLMRVIASMRNSEFPELRKWKEVASTA